MAKITSSLESLIVRAAELRVSGVTWASIGQVLHRAPESVRKWPTRYAELWAAAARDAERQLAADAEAESVLVLRQLLRSDDEKVRSAAARSLIHIRFERAKVDQKSAPLSSPPTLPLTSEAARLIAFLDGHSDEELAALVADLCPEPSSPPVPVEAAPDARAD